MSRIDPDNPKITAPAGRTPTGHFAPGNPGGPGNPYARKVAFLRQSLNECISASQVKQVVAAMFKLALAGNVPAARLFLQYAVGKPQEACNPDRIELDEFQLRQECADAAPNFETQINCPPLAVSNILVSINDSTKSDMYKREMIHAFTPEDRKPSARPQTAESVPAPVAQDADLPKAPEAVMPSSPATDDRQQTAESAPTHRQQTAQTAAAHRQQTAQTAAPHRQQTAQTVEMSRQQTAESAVENVPIMGARAQTA